MVIDELYDIWYLTPISLCWICKPDLPGNGLNEWYDIWYLIPDFFSRSNMSFLVKMNPKYTHINAQPEASLTHSRNLALSEIYLLSRIQILTSSGITYTLSVLERIHLLGSSGCVKNTHEQHTHWTCKPYKSLIIIFLFNFWIFWVHFWKW